MRLPDAAMLSDSMKQLQEIDIERVLGNVAATTINIVTPTIQKRAASSTCAANDNSAACQKPTDSTGTIQTLAIALGAGIPLGCAVVVLFFLHRRHMKRQKLEDLNDPHKSLDFGTSPGQSRNGKKHPEMAINELTGRRGRGLSMDMGSPYLLPGELNQSHASLRSMSRSTHDDNDPYRPVTLIKGDWESMRAPRRPGDNASMYSAATSMQSSMENSSLVANARPMSQSFAGLTPPTESKSFEPRQLKSERKPIPARKESVGSLDKPLPEPHSINLDDFVPPPPPPPPPKEEDDQRPPRSSSISAGSVTRPPRKSSIANQPVPMITEPFPEALASSAPTLPQIQTSVDADFDLSLYTEHEPALAQPIPQKRYSIMGLRPLPSDLPEDNPEQRANRIRSFYKEYFDDSRGNPKGGYVDDYDADYLADYAMYDSSLGGASYSNRPYAQPMGRRAMTPPPRGAQGPGAPHRRHMSTQSGRAPRTRALSAPRKRLPPPNVLTSLPTPHLLKDDASIFNAIDFAPPTSFRDRQAGRAPDSPLGVPRPYSPAVSAHSPLVASYDELAGVPSPYLLRKSGTFTALDFAPPPRFRDQSGASDAGSIRSNRSGISSVQQNAIRQGAYRVSRIPTEMVSSKEDLINQLKPRWDMRSGSNIMG